MPCFPMQPEQARRERFTAYAETLHKGFQTGILANLQERSLWVVWKPEQDTQGHIHKRPFTPNGYPASIYKPRQWVSVDIVLEALATGNFAGIGVMLPAPYVLIDKDATEDAPIYELETRKIVSPLALRLLEQVPSYAELSPNNGLHIITEGRPLCGNFKTPELEMYTNWFSTVTTRHLPGTLLDVTIQQAAILALENEFHPPVPERVFQNTGVLWELLDCLNSHRKQQAIRYYKNCCVGI
jgi:primase-polymerase (primpol)-like protein